MVAAGRTHLDDTVSGTARLGRRGPRFEDATDGQAIVVFHDDSEHKLVANAFVRDAQNGRTAVFGCYICPPEDIDIDLKPNTIEGAVGDQQAISVMAFFSYGLPKYVTGSCIYDPAATDPQIASRPTSSNGYKVGFTGSGFTLLTAEYFGCRRYSEFYNYEEGVECQCVENETLADVSFVYSKPKITGVSPDRGVIGSSITVTVNGAGFGTSPTVQVGGTGVTASVNSSSDTSITETFSIASSAAAGNHAVTVTSNNQTSSSVNLKVQVPSGLSYVDEISSQALSCTLPNNTPAAGRLRRLYWQVVDQDGDDIKASMSVSDSISYATPNTCGASGALTGSSQTTTGGVFPDTYSLCSTACLNGGNCQLPATQTWAIAGIAKAATVQVVYTCSSITVNGN